MFTHVHAALETARGHARERAIILQCMRSRQKRAFILDLDDRFPGFDPSSRACGSFALP